MTTTTFPDVTIATAYATTLAAFRHAAYTAAHILETGNLSTPIVDGNPDDDAAFMRAIRDRDLLQAAMHAMNPTGALMDCAHAMTVALARVYPS